MSSYAFSRNVRKNQKDLRNATKANVEQNKKLTGEPNPELELPTASGSATVYRRFTLHWTHQLHYSPDLAEPEPALLAAPR